MSKCNVNSISTDSTMTECQYCEEQNVAENMVVLDRQVICEDCEKVVMNKINEYEAI